MAAELRESPATGCARTKPPGNAALKAVKPRFGGQNGVECCKTVKSRDYINCWSEVVVVLVGNGFVIAPCRAETTRLLPGRSSSCSTARSQS